MNELAETELARYLEITLAKPEATRSELEDLCAEARRACCHGVCVNGSRVELVRTLLEDSPVRVIGLVGFPLGAMESDVKRYEAETAIDHGAQEVELVLNVGRLKEGDSRGVLRELRDIAEAADERPVKLALQTSLLTPEEITLACELALDSGVHAVATSSGLSTASVDEVKRLRALLGAKFEVKAVTDSADRADARGLISAGATRLGFAGIPQWARLG